MDLDGPSSSPPLRHTSLPPSSAPGPGSSSNGHSTPRRARPIADALAFDNDDVDGMQVDEEAGARRRGRPRTQNNAADVPLVRDPVSESVREAFETFLKTYVRDFLEFTSFYTFFCLQIYCRNCPSCNPCLRWRRSHRCRRRTGVYRTNPHNARV